MGGLGDDLGGGPRPHCGIGPLGLPTSDVIWTSGEMGGLLGKRVVITTFGSFGDLNPYLGLALGLKARGHDPVIATAEYYRPFFRKSRITSAKAVDAPKLAAWAAPCRTTRRPLGTRRVDSSAQRCGQIGSRDPRKMSVGERRCGRVSPI